MRTSVLSVIIRSAVDSRLFQCLFSLCCLLGRLPNCNYESTVGHIPPDPRTRLTDARLAVYARVITINVSKNHKLSGTFSIMNI